MPFATLQAAHRAARAQFLLLTWLCVGLGAAIIVAGLAGLLPQVPALIVGAVTLAVAVFPYREVAERGERLAGLLALETEWRALGQADPAAGQDRERCLALLAHLYDGK